MNISMKIMAVVVSVSIATLPFASAAQVNIIFNGVVQQTVPISPSNMVNTQLSVVHDPADITWSGVKILATVSSASLAYSVDTIDIFTCKLMNPVQCAGLTPTTFQTFADTELLWSDISQQEGAGTYPQTANIMILVKLTDQNGGVVWTGFWNTIKRTDFNIFNTFNFPLQDIDFHVSSMNFVSPAASFISAFQMLPFNWATNVEFQTSPLYALGGDAAELDVPTLTAASPPGNSITSINKEFFLVSSQTSSGVTNFVTLNQNPSFTCGDGTCDISLGESSSTCCYDCGCSLGNYCDIADAAQPQTGVCASRGGISISVVDPTVPPVTDCSQPLAIPLTVQVANPPASLPASASAIITLDSTPQPTTCTLQGNAYACQLQLQPPVSCGAGSFSVTQNSINMTLVVNDGPNQLPLDLFAPISDIPLSLTCGCPSGLYCDSALLTCQNDASLSVSVLNVTPSIISQFNPSGDKVTVTAQIMNPPSDLAVTGVTYTLGTLLANGAPIQNATTGSVTCSQSGPLLTCTIPILISNYDSTIQYIHQGNSLAVAVAYSDIGTTVTRTLTSAFTDIIVPSFQCGDGTCNVEESQTNCCTDCGCQASGMYCDAGRQSCDFLNSPALSVLAVSPTNMTGCLPAEPHTIDITAQVANPPSDLALNSWFYLQGGQVQSYPFTCQSVNPGAGPGLYDCALTLPPLPDCQQQPQDYILGPNALNFTVSFQDGNKGIVTQSLQSSFTDLAITPHYTIGDGVCESALGESSNTSCADCGCGDFGSGYFCDITPAGTGTCLDTNSINLIVDSPTSPVSFTSCEVTQTVNIKAHIENQPTSVFGTSFSATLNNTNADYLNCQFAGQQAGGNQSAPIECSLAVPPAPQCSLQNPVNTYDPNSLSASISFLSGAGTTLIHTSTAPLPPITVTQQIKSIFDITRESFQDMQKEVQETMKIVDRMLKWVEKCIDIAVTIMLLTMAAIVVGGAFAAFGEGTLQQNVRAAAQAGAGAMGMWTDFCKIITNYNNALLAAQQIKIEFRRAEFCIDLVQHEIDLGPDGPCFTQPMGCFDQLISCMPNIDSYMSQLSQYMDNAAAGMQSFGNNANQFSQGLGSFGSGTASLYVTENNNPLTNQMACNYRSTASQSQYNIFSPDNCPGAGPNDNDNLNIHVTPQQGCDYPYAVVTSSGAKLFDCQNNFPCSSSIDSTRNIAGDKWDITLYCFADQQDFQASDLSAETPAAPPYTVTVMADRDNDCICEGNSEGPADSAPSSPGSGGAVELTADSITPAVGEEVTFTVTIKQVPPGTSGPYNVHWNFGDGGDDNSAITTGTTSTAEHTYTTAGGYTATAVIDNIGSSNFLSITVGAGGSGGAVTVTGTTPADSATNVQLTATGGGIQSGIAITFSEMMDTSVTGGAANFKITEPAGSKSNMMLMTGTWSGMTTITFGSTMGFQPGTQYTIMVMGLKNMDGSKTLATHTFSFRTAGAAPSTNKPPVVTVTQPPDGSTVTGTVDLKGTAVDPEGDTIAKLELYIDDVLASGILVANPWRILYDTDANGVPDGSRTFTVKATDDKGAVGQVSVTLTVDNSGGSGPPAVVSTSPSGTVSSPVSTIVLTYNQDMTTGLLPTVTITSSGSTTSPTSAWTTNRILTITPVPSLTAGTYTVDVRGARNTAGTLQNPDPYSFTFTVT